MTKQNDSPTKALREAFAALEGETASGGQSAMARALRISPQAVAQWTQAPVNHVLKIASLTGIPPHRLRPDIYPEES